jgi:hypothetical protein
MKALPLLLAVTVLAALAAACAGGGDESVSPSPSATVLAEWSAPLSAVVNDLTLRSGAQAIAIVSVEPVDWPDACLGLPGPDEACAQVITPGLRVILSAAGRAYEYHTNLATHVRLVE